MGIQMNQKELIKKCMMFQIKKPFGLRSLYNNISAL